MVHANPASGKKAAELNRYRATFAEVEVLNSLVRKAKRAADESLRSVNAAPAPHTADNPAFVELFNAHRGDREALFAAMRKLERARGALRAAAERVIDHDGVDLRLAG